MKKLVLGILSLTLLPSIATADVVNFGDLEFTNGGSKVILHYTADDIGGGLTRFDVFVDDPTDAQLSWFLQALTFTGVINQDKAGVTPAKQTVVVDDDESAIDVWDGVNYDAATDSFFYRPWTENTNAPGITDSPNTDQGLFQRSYAITAGSGGGSTVDFLKVGQIVAAGIKLDVSGAIGRNGLTHNLQGPAALWVPEPSSFALLSMGAIGLAAMVRRRRSP